VAAVRPARTVGETFDEGLLRALLPQLAEGLIALHDSGKLHRDIKPSNVLVTGEGRLVLLDLGLVHDLHAQTLNDSANVLAGTIAYMAPEQIDQQVSEASDWYGVGVMLYEALVGQLPFAGNVAQVLLNKRQLDPPSPKSLAGGVPDDLDELCRDLLRRVPEERPTGGDVLRRLRAAHAAPPDADRPPASASHADADALFVGRQAQLAELRQALADVEQGRTVAVFLRGRSGVGKSALANRFLSEVRGRDEALLLTGRCFERESVPYKALDGIVDALSRHLRRLEPAEAARFLPRHASALAQVFPALQRVPAIAAASSRPETPDKPELRRRAFEALRELLARLGDARPLVLWIDDLQWGDVDSALLLQGLLRPPDAPVLLLVVCARSEDAQTSPCLNTLLRSPAAALAWRQLPVEPLSPDEVRELVRALSAGGLEAPPEDVECIARESGGNPYFVRELVSFAATSRERVRSGRAVLDEVIWSRVVELPAAARGLLGAVAVSGRPIAQRSALLAAGLSEGEHAPLEILRKARLVRTSGPRPDDDIECYHDRIRESVTARLDPAMLRDCHERIANELEARGQPDPERLAEHFAAAGLGAPAARYAIRAAEQATAALAFDRAGRLYRQAIDLDPAAATAVRRDLAAALANAGRGPEAAREYLRLSADSRGLDAIEFRRCAAEQLLSSGHIDQGIPILNGVLSDVGLAVPSNRAAAVLKFAATEVLLGAHGYRFRPVDEQNIPRELLVQSDIAWSAAIGLSMVDPIRGFLALKLGTLRSLRLGEPTRVGRSLALEASHAGTRGPRAGRKVASLLRSLDELAQRSGSRYLAAWCDLAAGISSYLQGDWPRGLEFTDSAKKRLATLSQPVLWEVDTADIYHLWSLCFLGRVAELRQRRTDLLQRATLRGDLYAATYFSTYIMAIDCTAEDKPDAGLAEMETAMARWSHNGFHFQHHNAVMAALMMELYRERPAEAYATVATHWRDYRRSLMLGVQHVNGHARSHRATAAIALALQDKSRSTSMLRIANRDRRALWRLGAPWTRAVSKQVEAGVELARGHAESSAAAERAAIELFDQSQMALYAAASRFRLGGVLQGESGRALQAQASLQMQSLGVVDPPRFSRIYAPQRG
jgi:hypothetical protein